MDVSRIFVWLFNIIVFILILVALLYFKYTPENLDDQALKWRDGPLKDLLNGSDINNIPNLVISTTNSEVADANNCSTSAILFGDYATDEQCIIKCMSSTAKAINVYAGDEVMYNNKKLNTGAYCTIGPRPQCNMKTTRAMMTINSITCVPKYPNLFGGPLGNQIIACNDIAHYNHNNVLWDYSENKLVNQYTIVMTDEDETLADGSFRFRCKFGRDERFNNYIEHLSNRFHPMRNYCTSYLYAAHPDVQFKKTEDSYICDCGNSKDTRVENLIPNDKTSPCSPFTLSDKLIREYPSGKRMQLSVPYKCFNVNSLITDVPNMLPCPEDKFTTQSAFLDEIKLEYVTYDIPSEQRYMVHHPKFDDFYYDT